MGDLGGAVTEMLLAYTATPSTRRRFLKKRQDARDAKTKADEKELDARGLLPSEAQKLRNAKIAKSRQRAASDSAASTARAVLLALVLSLAIYTCSSLYGDKHSLPLPALRDYVSHLARATKYLVGHKPKIRPTPIYVAPRESAVRPQRPISLMDIRQAADNLAVTTDTADSSRARQNVRWTVMQKGELLTVELFLSSKSVDSGTCATLWSQVAAHFPEELMRVSISYTGGGITKDKATGCTRGESECQGNKAALCLQKYMQSSHVLDVLACQARTLHLVPSNMDQCLQELHATEAEVEDVHRCLELPEGHHMWELNIAYTQLVLPSQKRRMAGCTMRLLDASGMEVSTCVRHQGTWGAGCGANASVESWTKTLCAHLRMAGHLARHQWALPLIEQSCPAVDDTLF